MQTKLFSELEIGQQFSLTKYGRKYFKVAFYVGETAGGEIYWYNSSTKTNPKSYIKFVTDNTVIFIK